ncbi:TPA: class I SAM-dependent methyltransferase [Legionella pneumophila]|nr:class I SAM-dependent methyltransferase [Legionella pneumophila]HAT3828030.1 class I SAM-dependent methyltransferase [Legionella pneumophila]
MSTVAQYKNYYHYISDGWSKEPKEMFKFLAQKIKELPLKPGSKLLDIGCATGELIHFLSKHFPQLQYTGIDVFDDLIEVCKVLQPNVNFINASALDLPFEFENQFDIITVVSVISIFDTIDLDIFWDNLFKATKDNGVIYVLSPFNGYGVDCEIRHRKRINNIKGEWERGWNIFCKETIAEYLEGRCKNWFFHPFKFNLELNQREDVIRTWTMKTEFNDKQLTNGMKLLVDHYLLEIHI